MSSITVIARNEFSRILMNPLTIVISCLLLLQAAISGVASPYLLPMADHFQDGNDHFLKPVMGNLATNTTILLSVLSMFIGILSIPEERWNGSMRVLLTKPLFRRDVYAGKFLGNALFILLFIITYMLICVSMVMVFSRGPESVSEAVLRIGTFILLLFMMCLLSLAFSMLVGVVFKDLYAVLIVNGMALCIEWFNGIPQFLYDKLGALYYLNPSNYYLSFLMGLGNNTYIFETRTPYHVWLSGAVPYIILFVLVIAGLFLLTSYLFVKEDV